MLALPCCSSKCLFALLLYFLLEIAIKLEIMFSYIENNVQPNLQYSSNVQCYWWFLAEYKNTMYYPQSFQVHNMILISWPCKLREFLRRDKFRIITSEGYWIRVLLPLHSLLHFIASQFGTNSVPFVLAKSHSSNTLYWIRATSIQHGKNWIVVWDDI